MDVLILTTHRNIVIESWNIHSLLRWLSIQHMVVAVGQLLTLIQNLNIGQRLHILEIW